MDFMIDSEFKPYLIEFNTNPCLETGCLVLKKVIGGLIENLFKLVIDPLFSSARKSFTDDLISRNNFELIYC